MAVIEAPNSEYSFSKDRPVPDGMRYSFITASHCPSNIATFSARNVLEAADLAYEAFRYGIQGALWLTDANLRFVQGDEANRFRERKRDAYLGKQFVDLCSIFADVMPRPLRQETTSNFFVHVDNRTNDNPDLDVRPNPLPKEMARCLDVRLIYNFDGIGTVLFEKNGDVFDSLCAGKILPVDSLGEAYICPTGSVLFLHGCSWGRERATIHSAPHVGALGADGVQGPIRRELAVLDCSPGR